MAKWEHQVEPCERDKLEEKLTELWCRGMGKGQRRGGAVQRY
jgi:hypothetical protein